LPLANSEDRLNEVKIWFDAEILLALQTSPAYTTIAGPSCEGTDLKSWLMNLWDFIEQVRIYCKALVDLHQKGDTGTQIIHFQDVGLQPQIATRAQIEYLVDVTLSAEEEGMPKSDARSTLTMQTAFTNIIQRPCKSSLDERGHVRQSQRQKQDAKHASEGQTTSSSSLCRIEGSSTDMLAL